MGHINQHVQQHISGTIRPFPLPTKVSSSGGGADVGMTWGDGTFISWGDGTQVDWSNP